MNSLTRVLTIIIDSSCAHNRKLTHGCPRPVRRGHRPEWSLRAPPSTTDHESRACHVPSAPWCHMLRHILCVALRCSCTACRAALCAAGIDRNGHCAPGRAQQTTNHEPVTSRLPHGAICCITSCVLRCAAAVQHAARHCAPRA